jgi:hypothetical protein
MVICGAIFHRAFTDGQGTVEIKFRRKTLETCMLRLDAEYRALSEAWLCSPCTPDVAPSLSRVFSLTATCTVTHAHYRRWPSLQSLPMSAPLLPSSWLPATRLWRPSTTRLAWPMLCVFIFVPTLCSHCRLLCSLQTSTTRRGA